MIKLDKYEKELLYSVERGEWIRRSTVNRRVKELQFYIKKQKRGKNGKTAF